MRFVRISTKAGELRGEHIANELDVPCDEEFVSCESGEAVVFIKSLSGSDKAKNAGALVIYDPVDHYCYDDGRDLSTVHPEVSLLIVPNKRCREIYKTLFPNADYLIIPHQWDMRITDWAQHDEFRPGYIGRKFNLTEELRVPMVTDPDEQLAAMSRFNCHINQRAWRGQAILKPATKVACASAVDAVIVTSRDDSALELLGAEYPFFAQGTLMDSLWRARKAFGTQQWEDARQIMSKVRARTALSSVADLYRPFL